jgi:hypothetical protein
VVVLVGVVGPVLGAGPEDAPEGAAVHAGFETRDVDVAEEAAFGKGLAKGLIVDMVVVNCPDQDGQVIMSICQSNQLSVTVRYQ